MQRSHRRRVEWAHFGCRLATARVWAMEDLPAGVEDKLRRSYCQTGAQRAWHRRRTSPTPHAHQSPSGGDARRNPRRSGRGEIGARPPIPPYSRTSSIKQFMRHGSARGECRALPVKKLNADLPAISRPTSRTRPSGLQSSACFVGVERRMSDIRSPASCPSAEADGHSPFLSPGD